jgi:glycosyltransferase involved in cell wall biosynthesis
MCVPKRLRIGLIPYDPGVNLYTERLRTSLSALGEVVPVGSPIERLARMFAREPSFDVVITSWLENVLVTPKGRLSIVGLGKLIAHILMLRAQSRRIVYVRHNRYPHNARAAHAKRLSLLLDVLERLYDLTLTHSPAELAERRAYCPHPLYESVQDDPLLPRDVDLEPGYFVVFGRIAPYKNVEALIEGFPDNQRLLITGLVDDHAAYARQLMQLRRPNVVIAPGYLSEAQAQSVLRRAAGVVVCHSGEGVIVTGSFFYAISLSKPVYAVETPFLRAIQARVGPRVLLTAKDVPELCRRLGSVVEAPTHADWNNVRAVFGDANVCRHLSAVLERLGLIETFEEEAVADVAE